jgi:hypothetical protein
MNRILIGISIGLVLALIMVMTTGCAARMSWDQETLSKESNLMTCPDHNYVFGTVNGQLKECL